jgi:hypothetical protein
VYGTLIDISPFALQRIDYLATRKRDKQLAEVREAIYRALRNKNISVNIPNHTHPTNKSPRHNRTTKGIAGI